MGSGTSEVQLPGFGLPITDSRRKDRFPSALDFDESSLAIMHPLPEYMMVELMNTITDKVNWQKKIFDEAIVQKWRDEIVKDAPSPTETANSSNAMNAETGDSAGDGAGHQVQNQNVGITEKMFHESIAELKYKAELMEITNSVEAPDDVFKSDTIIPEQLRIALESAVESLENIPEREKDWHPGTNEQVLDLVHPSLYPLVYGQTRILPSGVTSLEDCFTRCGEGVTLEVQESIDDADWSKQFQWLPSDFEALTGSDEVKITSYINNLHPAQHPNLYRIIEQVVAKVIPMWNQTLTCSTAPARARVVMANDGYGDVGPEPDWNEEQDGDENENRLENWRESRPIIFPEPKRFEPPAPTADPCHPKFDQHLENPDHDSHKYAVDLRAHFNGHLQVIVKLANIYLTPDKPEYAGGSWHVEGQANESICASAIYYYSCDNISDSHLSFRQEIDSQWITMEVPYAQDDHRAIKTIYGFELDDPAVKEVGSVLTRQGRVVTFSNKMQHRVNPFSLIDRTRPGHRKILALFLVDPHQRIISTANVPCQQKAWWDAVVRQIDPLRNKLPPEILEHILSLVDDFPVSLDVAKAQRETLMQERSASSTIPEEGSWATFSLCEH